MAGFLEALPPGFGKTVELLNEIPESTLCEMCHRVVCSLKINGGSSDLKKIEEVFQNEQLDLSSSDQIRIINAITYLFRKAVELHVSSADFSRDLSDNLHIANTAVSVLKQIWEEQGPSLMSADTTSQIFGVGQLVDMQWKLGVGISSDTCKNLNTPYITMQVKVADTSGKLSTHTFEMTVSQFQNFSKQMKEMASVLETV